MHQLGITVAVVTAVVFSSDSAYGFCRKTNCEVTPTPTDCAGTVDANGCSNEGLPLHWGSPCFSFSVHVGGSSKSGISSSSLELQVRSAFDTWSAVVCDDGGSPNFFAATYPQVTCEETGYRSDGPNQNLWIFRDDSWEHEIAAGGTLALTTLSVESKTGSIFDADVELNSMQNTFTIGDDQASTDLFSIVLHESGHVLGIGHSPWSTSTMGNSYLTGTLDMRTPEADDINAICAILPPGELPARCDPEPREGFSTQCDETKAGCSCSVTRGLRDPSLPPWGTMALLMLVTRSRKRAISSQTWNHRSPKDAQLLR